MSSEAETSLRAEPRSGPRLRSAAVLDCARTERNWIGLVVLLLLAFFFPSPALARPAPKPPVTILISIDGFRPDYLNRGVTPALSRLARTGVAAAMRPSFPSKTFPNHWALVTGLRPDRNGIVANTMEDPARPGETFTMATDDPFWWNEAEPIWVSAEHDHVRTATMFWPGSNVAWGGRKVNDFHHPFEGGTRPEDWQQFNGQVTGTQRVNTVLDWLRRPAAIRPRFVTLYFDQVDAAGHEYGPDDSRTTAAVADVDGLIGELVSGLAALRQPVNLVIVADHGMAATSSARVIPLDRIADPADYRVIEAGPYASLVPVAGHEAALEAALLAPHQHFQCWRKAEIPARFHYGANRRVPPWLCLAETAPVKPFTGGDHGYDNDAPEMRALFIASGPAFVAGARLPEFDNVDVYPLIAKLIGVKPRPGDGTIAPFLPTLRH